MKKTSLIACCVLLLAATARAQEKTSYDIGEDMLALIETYAACASGDITCTEDEALALQADARNILSDFVRLIVSGRVKKMIMSAGQMRAFSERACSMHKRLEHIELFDAFCNRSILLIGQALNKLILAFFTVILSGGGLFAVVYGGVVLLIYLVPVLGAFILMTPCLFWWL